MQERAAAQARDRLVEVLVPAPRKVSGLPNPLEALFGGGGRPGMPSPPAEPAAAPAEDLRERRAAVRARLDRGELDRETVEIETEESALPTVEVFSGQGVEEMGINLQDLFGTLLPRRRKQRRMGVPDALRALTAEEAQKLIDMEEVVREGVRRAEQAGIIFIDELDKIAGRRGRAPGPTCRAKACSATSCRSSRGRR